MISLFAIPALAIPTPGLQVVDCVEDPPGSGNWSYLFFVCTGDFEANDLHVDLVPAEISEGTVVLCCTVPDLPDYTCQ